MERLKVEHSNALKKWGDEREQLTKGLERMLESKIVEVQGWQNQLDKKTLELNRSNNALE